MSPRFLLPWIDLMTSVVFVLALQDPGVSEAPGQQVRIQRERPDAHKIELRVAADGTFQLGDQHLAAEDPRLVNVLKSLHDDDATLHVLVAEGASASFVFRTMQLVEQAGFQAPFLRPTEQR